MLRFCGRRPGRLPVRTRRVGQRGDRGPGVHAGGAWASPPASRCQRWLLRSTWPASCWAGRSAATACRGCAASSPAPRPSRARRAGNQRAARAPARAAGRASRSTPRGRAASTRSQTACACGSEKVQRRVGEELVAHVARSFSGRSAWPRLIASRWRICRAVVERDDDLAGVVAAGRSTPGRRRQCDAIHQRRSPRRIARTPSAVSSRRPRRPRSKPLATAYGTLNLAS